MHLKFGKRTRVLLVDRIGRIINDESITRYELEYCAKKKELNPVGYAHLETVAERKSRQGELFTTNNHSGDL